MVGRAVARMVESVFSMKSAVATTRGTIGIAIAQALAAGVRASWGIARRGIGRTSGNGCISGQMRRRSIEPDADLLLTGRVAGNGCPASVDAWSSGVEF